jgi:hypothetical protein
MYMYFHTPLVLIKVNNNYFIYYEIVLCAQGLLN